MKNWKILISLFLIVDFVFGDDPFPGVDWDSGFVNISSTAQLYYLLFKTENSGENTPFILFLAGGPGISATVQSVMDSGPYLFDMNSSDPMTAPLIRNPYSWTDFADLLLVDSPLGVGFSYSSNASEACKDRECYSSDLYKFLVGFLEEYEQYIGRPFYIVGDSYAGHYVPVLGAYLLKMDDPRINFKGIGLASPWVDPKTQMGTSPKYAIDNGIINWLQWIYIKATYLLGEAFLLFNWYGPAGYIWQLGQKEIFGVPEKFDPYDIRLNKDPWNSTLYNGFMDLHKKEFNVPDDRSYCNWNMTVFNMLFPKDLMMSALDELSQIVQADKFVVSYYGEFDFMCNWIGGLKMNDAVSWDEIKTFKNMPLRNVTYYPNETLTVFGLGKQYLNYAYLDVYGGDHCCMQAAPQPTQYLLKILVGNHTYF